MRTRVSKLRRDIAIPVNRDGFVVVESAGDPQGFTWWLAKVTEIAWQQARRSRSTTVDNLILKKDEWYLKVKYYNREPVHSRSSFMLCEDEYTIHAEGVVAAGSILDGQLQPLRRTRHMNLSRVRALKLKTPERVYEEIEAELQRLSLEV